MVDKQAVSKSVVFVRAVHTGCGMCALEVMPYVCSLLEASSIIALWFHSLVDYRLFSVLQLPLCIQIANKLKQCYIHTYVRTYTVSGQLKPYQCSLAVSPSRPCPVWSQRRG